METYPRELLNDPRPLVILIGNVENEPDFHQRLIRNFESTNYENDFKDFPKLSFQSIVTATTSLSSSSSGHRDVDFQFQLKKATKDNPSIDGILRSNWFLKHYDQLPSVVLFITWFSVDWSLSEWIRREAGFHERYSRLKASLTGRGCTIMVILIKLGSIGLADKDVIEERVNSLKRHLQLDSKTLTVLTLSDIAAAAVNSLTSKRLVKIMREFSFAYYTAQYKKAKTFERISKTRGVFEYGLCARYSIKASYFLEFLGQSYQPLQLYRQSYQAIQELCKHYYSSNSSNSNVTSNTVESGNGLNVSNGQQPQQQQNKNDDILDQAKCLGDYINFKICSLLLKTGNESDAYDQFRFHLSLFVEMRTTSIIASLWNHFAWIAKQYIVYAQLLDKYAIKESISVVGNDRAFYYRNAARYMKYRYESFLASTSNNNSNNNARDSMLQNESNFSVGQSRYLGSVVPTIYDTAIHNKVLYTGSSDASNSDELKSYYLNYIIRQMLTEEQSVDHSALILSYLWLAHDKIDMRHRRRRADLRALIAEQHMTVQQYDEALTHFIPMVEFLIVERFTGEGLLLSLLKQKCECEYWLGKAGSFVVSALTFYSLLCQKVSISGTNKKDVDGTDVALESVQQIEFERKRILKQLFEVFHYQSTTVQHDLTRETRSVVTPCYGYYSSIITVTNSTSTTGTIIVDNNNDNTIHHKHNTCHVEELSNQYVIELTNTMKIFEVHTSFSQKCIELGNIVRVKVTIASLLCETIVGRELVFSFSTTQQMIKRFRHDDSSSNNNTGDESNINNNITSGDETSPASLIFPGSNINSNNNKINHTLVPVEFNFELYIPDNFLDSISSHEWGICLESVQLTLAVPLAISSSSTMNASSNGNKSISHRDIAFNIVPLTDAFLKSRELFSKTAGSSSSSSSSSVSSSSGGGASILEVSKYLNYSQLPSILKLHRPIAKLILLNSNKTIKLCQGSIQQINTYFNVTNQCPLLNCRVYLSVDYSPRNVESSFFWFPNVKSTIHHNSDTNNNHNNSNNNNNTKDIANGHMDLKVTEKVIDNEHEQSQLDNIIFHPFRLNASKQPEQPLVIPNHQQFNIVSTSSTSNDSNNNTTGQQQYQFAVPLFVRSDQEGLFKIKMMFEYSSKPNTLAVQSTACSFDVIFQNPLDMKFQLTNTSVKSPCISATASSAAISGYSSSNIGTNNNIESGNVIQVKRGEKVRMSSTLTCTHPVIERSIQLLSMTGHLGAYSTNHNNTLSSNTSSLSPSHSTIGTTGHSNFKFRQSLNNSKSNNNGVYDVLSRLPQFAGHSNVSNDKSGGIKLKCGECFNSHVDFRCESSSSSSGSRSSNRVDNNGDVVFSTVSPSTSAVIETLSHVITHIRVVDDYFMKPPFPHQHYSHDKKYQWLFTPISINQSTELRMKRLDSKAKPKQSPTTKNNTTSDTGGSHGQQQLHNNTVNDGAKLSGLDYSAAMTRVCKLIFSSPSVNILDVSFEVYFRVCYPNNDKTVHLGDIIVLEYKIRNKLMTAESILFFVKNIPTEFLITGSLSNTILLVPGDEYYFVKLQVMPIVTGFLTYPEMALTWLKDSTTTTSSQATIEQTESDIQVLYHNNTDRTVFVYPSKS